MGWEYSERENWLGMLLRKVHNLFQRVHKVPAAYLFGLSLAIDGCVSGKRQLKLFTEKVMKPWQANFVSKYFHVRNLLPILFQILLDCFKFSDGRQQAFRNNLNQRIGGHG